MHRKKILLALGLSISLSLATPSVVFAADVSAGDTVHISSENIDTNNGTVERNNDDITIETNNGSVQINAGTVETNNGRIDNNIDTGTVETNAERGSIGNNAGEVGVNNGTISENDGTVETNNGTIGNNSGGTVKTNNGTVNTNNGDIQVNTGTVTVNNSVIMENQGSVEGGSPTSHVEVNNGGSVSGEGTVHINNGGTVTGEGKVEINLSHSENVAPTVTVVQQMWKLNYNNMNGLSITDCRDHDKANIYTMQDNNGKLQVWLWEDGSVIVKPLGDWDVMNLSADNGAKVEKRSDGTFRISNVTRDTNLGFTLYNYTGSDDDYDYNNTYKGWGEDIRKASYTSVDANGNPIDIKITARNTSFDWVGYFYSATGSWNHNTVFTGVIEGATKGSTVRYNHTRVFSVSDSYRVYVVFRNPLTGEMAYVDLGIKDDGSKLKFDVPFENCEFAIIMKEEKSFEVRGTTLGLASPTGSGSFQLPEEEESQPNTLENRIIIPPGSTNLIATEEVWRRRLNGGQ